jgi:hypothetical protein
VLQAVTENAAARIRDVRFSTFNDRGRRDALSYEVPPGERVFVYPWNIQRCTQLEAHLQEEAAAAGIADAMLDDQLSRKIDRLWRYKRMHESTLRQATSDFRKLKTEEFFRNEKQLPHSTRSSRTASRSLLLWRNSMRSAPGRSSTASSPNSNPPSCPRTSLAPATAACRPGWIAPLNPALYKTNPIRRRRTRETVCAQRICKASDGI